MGETEVESRVRRLESKQDVHEAVCAERYKAINLRLNIMLGLLIGLLGSAAMGNPLLAAIRGALAGSP